MGSNKKYWGGLDELHETPAYLESRDKEFNEELPVDEFLADSNLDSVTTGRRDFLKFLGFSVAAVTLASCEAPVIKSVPYVNKPEDIVPGVANWYASSYYDGNSFANILVKTREGRPIFIKGNRDHGITNGAINPRISASVLSLYDSERLGKPMKGTGDEQEKISWTTLDNEVQDQLEDIAKKGGEIVLLSNTIISPSTRDVIAKFKMRFGGADDLEETPAVAANAAPGEVDDVIDAAENQVAEADTTQMEDAPQMPAGEYLMPTNVGSAKIRHVQYDAVSYNGIRKANKSSFGKDVIPSYDFSKAKTIVGISCDFLSTWLSANQYVGQYSENRNPDKDWMSKHWQFESVMSTTGANSDSRSMIKPSEQGLVAAALLDAVGGNSGVDTSVLNDNVKEAISKCADDLKSAGKGKSLIVCGSNDRNVQTMVNALNAHLGNYEAGSTINLEVPLKMFQGDDAAMEKLANDVIGGNGPDALIMIDVNPAYTLPNGAEFAEGLENVGLTVSFSRYADETASRCQYIAPDHHQLETWNDCEPVEGYYSVIQPAIRPVRHTRAMQETLLVWSGVASRGDKESEVYYNLIKHNWVKYGYPMAKDYYDSPEEFWNWMVHNGGGQAPTKKGAGVSLNSGAVSKAASGIKGHSGGDWEVVCYQKPGMGIGEQAGNPWLQEMPDTISKVTWDNYITMAPSDVDNGNYNKTLGQESPASMATVSVGDVSFDLPVVPSPGQTPGTIGVAVGYGRGENGEAIGKAAYQTKEYGGYLDGPNGGKTMIGQNAFKLASLAEGQFLAEAWDASLSKTDEEYPMALAQTHHTAMGRDSVVKETTFDFYKTDGQKEPDYVEGKPGYNPSHAYPVHEDVNGDGHIDANDRKHVSEYDLWKEHPVEEVGHHWGMSIDLNSCIGCGSCLISCVAENNVPVVGKDEVRRARDMAWLRLDRYYQSEDEITPGHRKDDWSYGDMEKPEANPKVVFMPMMCQHCNHAPCETVCPVVATTHSNEGLNQMTYNRCIGTRYCANNCPYKVRRFNWFNYPSYGKFGEVNPAQDDLGRMVLNPDVTVRTRGVMEKCSMCVQRIQAGKLEAKSETRPVEDGDITTACQDACPTNAITFGDRNNMPDEEGKEGSELYKLSNHNRAYQALEEIGVKPNIWYQLKVRNTEEEYYGTSTESESEAEEA